MVACERLAGKRPEIIMNRRYYCTNQMAKVSTEFVTLRSAECIQRRVCPALAGRSKMPVVELLAVDRGRNGRLYSGHVDRTDTPLLFGRLIDCVLFCVRSSSVRRFSAVDEPLRPSERSGKFFELNHVCCLQSRRWMLWQAALCQCEPGQRGEPAGTRGKTGD